jgi:hypothetical protein
MCFYRDFLPQTCYSRIKLEFILTFTSKLHATWKNGTHTCCMRGLLPRVTFSKSPDDMFPKREPSIQTRILTSEEKILEQEKGSVCDTGQIYAGTVDNPILVTPLLKMRCTLTREPPQRWAPTRGKSPELMDADLEAGADGTRE